MANNSLPAFGTMQTTLSTLFINETASPVIVSMLKLVNSTSSLRTLSVYLNSSGYRTPLLPESFQLKAGHMASDQLTLSLRKDDALEGFADAPDSISFIVS